MGAPPCGSDYTTTWASRVPAGEVLMAILDDVIGVFSPGWKAARLRSRAVIQAYEAV
ncbi:phage portal protein, partial [Escherichia coli]